MFAATKTLTSISTQELENKVLLGCQLKLEIKKLQAKLDELDKIIIPFMGIDDRIATAAGSVILCPGRINTKWLVSDEQKKIIQESQRQELLERGLIVDVKGDPYLKYIT